MRTAPSCAPRVRALWGLTFRTEHLRTYTEFVSMTTIVRCPRTGRACSEGACRERHWLSAAVRARPVAQRAAFEAKIILRGRRLNWGTPSFAVRERAANARRGLVVSGIGVA